MLRLAGSDVWMHQELQKKETLTENRSFIIQIAGGLMTISENFKTLQNGLNIYTAGVALQEFFIFCFLFLVFSFHKRLLKEETDPSRLRGAKKLLFILYASLALISVRQSSISMDSNQRKESLLTLA